MGKWTTCEQAIDAMRAERAELCPAHRREWDNAREDARIATLSPAPVTLMHVGESPTVHAENVRRRQVEQWLAVIDNYQQVALRRCQRGIGCTITEPVQGALPGVGV
jgi:hypothetical protein